MQIYTRGCWNCGRQPPSGQCESCWGCKDCCADEGNVHGCAFKATGRDPMECILVAEAIGYEQRMRERTGNRHWPFSFITACCRADFFKDGELSYCETCRLQAQVLTVY